MSVTPTLNQSPEKEKAELADRVKSDLRRLHIPGTVRGFNYLLYILLEVVPNPSQLTLVTESLYPSTARAFGVTSSSVERAIRTAVSICWRCGGREVLEQMALHHLSGRPTAMQFIDIVSDHIRRTASQ